VKINKNKLTNYWLKIPIANVRGGIYLPIIIPKNAKEVCSTWKLKDSKIIKKNNEFYAHLTFEKEVEERTSYNGVLAIDLGQRFLAVSASTNRSYPKFYGREARGIRRHFDHLRRKLGEKKLLKKIKSIGSKESRIILDLLHRVSKAIVDEAAKYNLLLVLGKLKGIRKAGVGRMLNRILGRMPFFKLANFIKYKAAEKGIRVVEIIEKNTSRTCSKCDYKDQANRKSQGLFCCKECGCEVNADFNGAKNILSCFLQLSKRTTLLDGVAGSQPTRATI
jgi:putative transposase